MTHKNTAKGFERRTAAMLSDILGVECKRTPLSGMNSGHGPGDVIIPEGFDLLIEDKLRALFQHHTLFREARDQAKKFGIKNTILCTQKKNENGFLVTIDNVLFTRIMKIPGVIDTLRRGMDEDEIVAARLLAEDDFGPGRPAPTTDIPHV